MPAHVNLEKSDDGDACVAKNGYDDIGAGAQVEVQDASGKALALGALESGVRRDSYRCVFEFTVYDIPKGENIHAFQVGNLARGSVKFTRSQLDAGSVSLTIG